MSKSKRAISILTRKTSLFLMMSLLVIVALCVTREVGFNNEQFKGIKTAYKSSLHEIESYNPLTNHQVSISDFYNSDDGVFLSVKSSYTVPSANTNITIKDGKELYGFSRLLNTDESFLSYNYQLVANIDYIAQYPFIPIAWQASQIFSGVFDGQGYEIKGLQFMNLTPESIETYISMVYFSMFSKLSGTVKNVGLVETNFAVNVNNSGSMDGVAPLIGMNEGTVENVYVKDLRDPVLEEAGITAAGGYRLSGLMVLNKGIFRNSYTAYSIISNYTISDFISFREIVDVNDGGTLENICFYNSSIVEVTADKYVYSPGLVNISIAKDDMVGDYCSSLEVLNNKFSSLSSWFTSGSYSEVVQKAILIKTPVLRGLREEGSLIFNIYTPNDYAYMYELMRKNALFSSKSVTYKIQEDLDLSRIPSETYQYDSYVSANIFGVYKENRNTLSNVLNQYSGYPTIYNASIMNAINDQGIRAYGLFPLFSGSIKDLNMYAPNVLNFEKYEATISVKAIGLLCGIIEGATIENVNVKGNISLTTIGETANYDFGKYYVGMIAGILSDGGKITQTTSAGKIDGKIHNAAHISNLGSNGYVSGNTMSGIVGYVKQNGGSLINCLSATNLQATVYNQQIDIEQSIGGIVGAGYSNELGELLNKGNISLGSSANFNYGIVYAAGVIGRHLGVTQEVTKLHNQGNIDFFLGRDNSIASLSGVSNTDIVVAKNTNLFPSTFKDAENNSIYWASAFSNSGNIAINNSSANNANNNLHVVGISYINAINGFKSKITGFYNLGYKYDDNNRNVTLESSVVDMAAVNEYAPCVVSSGNSNQGLIEATTVYNLRKISYITTRSMQYQSMKYSGCLSGKYFALKDVRNEGDLSFLVTNDAQANNKKIIIYGVFEELSNGCNATQIYNGGDIDFYIGSKSVTNLSVTADLFISGVCYANRNIITGDKYNPLSDKYRSMYVGSLDEAINNGNIESNSYGLGRLNTSGGIDGSANVNGNTTLRGNVRLSGICSVNESIISNSFNLGNITSCAYALDYSLESAGIAWINAGGNAQIRDSANNGSIKTINMSTSNAFVISSGITCRNDVLEDGSAYLASSNHQKQLLAFTINYGTIYAFNYCENITNTTSEPHSKAAGILGMGLCNILNTVNYGNILGSEAASGIFCYVEFYKFAANVDKVTIANSINYGNIKSIMRFKTVGGTPTPITYLEVLTVSLKANTEFIGYGYATYGQYNAAIISIISYSGTKGGTTPHANAKNISARYLINFFTDANVVNTEIAVPVVDSSVNKTIFTTKKNDLFMGTAVVYAPLSSKEDADGNIGVFSKNFAFRLAIEGQVVTTAVTDKYLADYFQFVGFSKINQNLLETIGWRSIAYSEAANKFATDLKSLGNLMDKYNSLTGHIDFVNAALATENWVQNCDPTVLKTLINSILSSQTTQQLKSIVEYLFFDSNYSNSLSSDLKQVLISELMDSSNKTKDELVQLLDSLFYSDLISNIITEQDDEFKAIKNLINDKVNSLTLAQVQDIYKTYIGYLSNEKYYDEMFSDSKYSKAISEVLETLLAGIDEKIYEDIFKEIEKVAIKNGTNVEYSVGGEISYALGKLDSASKSAMYLYMISNNAFSESTANVYTSALKKFNLEEYCTPDKTEVLNSFNSQLNTANLGTISTTGRDYDVNGQVDTTASLTSLNRAATDVDYSGLWNMVKSDVSVQKYLNSSLGNVSSANNITHKGIYALATEFTNSYQSNDSPAGLTGRIRGTTVSSTIQTRYIFTPDNVVNESTYFYGPYTSAASNAMWTYQKNSSAAVEGSTNIGFVLFDNSVAGTTQRYVPVFISLDNQHLTNLISSSINKNTYAFIWNNYESSSGSDAHNQWVSTDIITSQPADSIRIIKKNTNSNIWGTNSKFLQTDGVTPYYFDFDTVGRTTYTSENSLGLITNRNTSTSEASTYLTAYASSSIISGIYYQQDQWDRNGAFLTSKGAAGRGVATTQFIDYTVNDLINLDGKLTKGRSNGSTISNEELQIINILMQEIMATPEGKSAIMTSLGKSISKGVTESNFKLSKVFMTSLVNANDSSKFANDFLMKIANDSNSHSLYINSSNDLFSSIKNANQSANYSYYEKVLYASMQNKEYFMTVLNYLLDEDSGYYGYLMNSSWYQRIAQYQTEGLEQSDLEYAYSLIKNLQEKGYSDAEISTFLNVDVSQIEDYLNSQPSVNDVLIPNQTDIGDFKVDSNFTANVETAIYEDHKYSSNIKTTNTGRITFSVASNCNLHIIARATSGTIELYNGNTLISTKQVSSLSKISFDNLASGNYEIRVSANVAIYNIYTSTVSQGSLDNSSMDYYLQGYSKLISNLLYTITSNNVVGVGACVGINFSQYIGFSASPTLTFVPYQDATMNLAAMSKSTSSSVTLTISDGSTSSTKQFGRTLSGPDGFSYAVVAGKTYTITFNNANIALYSFSLNESSTDFTYQYVNDSLSGVGGEGLPFGFWANVASGVIGSNNGDSVNSLKMTVNINDNNNILKINANDSSGTSTLHIYDNNNVLVASRLLTMINTTYFFENLPLGKYTLDFGSYVEITSINSEHKTTKFDTEFANNFIAQTYSNYLSGAIKFTSNIITQDVIDKLASLKNQEFNTSGLTPGLINSNTSYSEQFKINATASSNIEVISESQTIAGISFDKALDFRGIGNMNSRNISFEISNNSSIYVYAKASKNTELVLMNNVDSYSSIVNNVGNVSIFKINATTPTTYYLYGADGGVMIYKIVIVNEDKTLTQADYDKNKLQQLAKTQVLINKFPSVSKFAEIYNRNYNYFINTNRESKYYLTNTNSLKKLEINFMILANNSSIEITATSAKTATLIDKDGTVIATIDLAASDYHGVFSIDNLAIGEYTISFNGKVEITKVMINDISSVMDMNGFKLDNCLIFNGSVRETNSHYSDLAAIINIFFGAKYPAVSTPNNPLHGAGFDIWTLLNKEDVVDLIKSIASKDEELVRNFISSCSSDVILANVISKICAANSNFLSDVMKKANLSNLTSEQKELFVQAYIGTDFAVNLKANTLVDSLMYQILQELQESSEINFDYQFINEQSGIDNDKFIQLMMALGFNLSTDGFGIYALSSSDGILNGNFIPDNIELASLDANYSYDGTIGFVLSDVVSADWRGLTNNEPGSVNKGFYVDMKQLIKSIATTVFEIELMSGGHILSTSADLINVKTGEIYFYIPINYATENLTFMVNPQDYLLSYMAFWSINTQNISLTPAKTVDGVVSDTFIVTAEDPMTTQVYTVYLVTTSSVSLNVISVSTTNEDNCYFSYDAAAKTYTTEASVPYENGNITLRVQTSNLANGTDLSKYISIDNQLINYSYASTPNVEVMGEDVLGTGVAIISFDINANMSSGEHKIKIALPSMDTTYYITFTKEAGQLAEIIKFNFNAENLTFDNFVKNSNIIFGRGYTYDELTNLDNGYPSYLKGITISPRATLKITAKILIDGIEQTVNSNKTFNGGIMTYQVIFEVTSESKAVVNTYTHNLIEVDPFAQAKDVNGDFITDNETYRLQYLSSFSDGHIDSTALIDLAGEVNVSHYRGAMPKYRFVYNLDGFYSAKDNLAQHLSTKNSIPPIVNSVTNYSLDVKNYGFTLNFSDEAEPDNYIFNLLYSNSSISWGSSVYERIYDCPDLRVNKLYSTDAQLKKVTFITSSSNLANIATVLSINSIRPNVANEALNPGETNYKDLINSPENNIIYSSTNGIHYTTKEAQNALEYYMVGTVSNATLEDYAPTFKIENHANIYQYFTINNDKLLLVPYDSNGVTTIFLASVDWSRLYLLQLDENNQLQLASNNINQDKSFSYNGQTYHLNEYAGLATNNNKSLFMDYIGSPEDNYFWFVDYIVFSEDAVHDVNSTNYKLYHVAMIDSSNTVYFDITVKAPTTLNLDSIYLSVYNYEAVQVGGSTGSYAKGNLNSSISSFADYSSLIDGSRYYSLDKKLQVLKRGFFYFYLDLPDGFACQYTVTSDKKDNKSELKDLSSYLPPASIVTQKISITIEVIDKSQTDVVWGESFTSQIGQLAFEIKKQP